VAEALPLRTSFPPEEKAKGIKEEWSLSLITNSPFLTERMGCLIKI